jgi:glycosyltransferase 2 family protein
VGGLVGLALFGWTLRDFELDSFARTVGALGPSLALIFLPQLLGSVLHAAGLGALLRGLGTRFSPSKLLSIVLSSQAANMALPAGVVVSESVSAAGLVSGVGQTWSEAFATLGVKKAWHLAGHGFWMVVLSVVAWDELAALQVARAPRWLPVAAAWAVTASLVGSASFTLILLSSERAARAFTRAALRVPIARLRTWAATRTAAGHAERTLVLPRGAHLACFGWLIAQWGAVVFETFLVLRLLGVAVSFEQALILEMGVVMLRALAFAVPGQVGVQDAGYVAILSSFGVAGAAELGATFVVLRRGKDVVFVLLGLATSGAWRRAATVAPE